jgi:hypothetical protein
METLDDEEPASYVLENRSDATKREKADYLRKIASIIVDDYVINQKRNEDILRSVQIMQHAEEAKAQEVNSEGRYRCRARGCPKTFAHDGKLRSDHEASHNPPVVVHKPQSETFIIDSDSSEKDRHDMLAYQRALLEYGMLIINFWDGIAEGDGERGLCCWKFFLMYLKHQGGSSTKYTLEALYFMFQVYALLSPQAAHRLIWNRSLKNKKGSSNIPLDLMLEFFNKTMKQAVKNLGPAASEKSLNRIANSLGFTVELLKVFDSSLSVFKRSGKHIKKSSSRDTEKIVMELIENDAFTFTEGRKYTSYSNMKPSILCGVDMQKMFHWINEHKKYMILYRRAR